MRIHYGFLFLALAGCGEVVAPGGANGTDAGPQPELASVSPDHGPVVGGVEISLTGGNYQAGDVGDTQVVVGGVAATDVAVADDGTVTFTLPPGGTEGEVVDVTVFNQNGFATLPDAFRYNEKPIVLSISPELGRGAGGTNVTITGRGFDDLEAGTPTVTLAGAVATNVVVVDDQTITATTAASTADAFIKDDVVVDNANGVATLSNGFAVTQPGLIAVERCCSNRVFYVNPTTGDATEIGITQRQVKNCATSPSGTIFASARRPADSVNELLTFDPLTGTVTALGPTTDGVGNRSVSGLSFVGNTLYGFTSRVNNSTITRNLVTLNTTTGAATAVGAAIPASGSRCVGLAAKDANSLYLVDRLNETLDTIATATGTVTVGAATLNGPSNNAHGMVVIDGVTYLVDRSTATIYTADTTSGALTELSRIPNTSIGGLCATPSTF